MAISLFDTYNLLNDYRFHILENEWPFNQVLGTGAPTRECPVYTQIDRDMIAEKLTSAFDLLTEYMGYPPAPAWYYEDIPLGMGRYDLQHIELENGHLIEVGQRAVTLIEAGTTVTYSDVQGFGVNDTATISVTAATTIDEDELFAFFRTADGAPSVAHQQYAILPLTRSRSGTTVTLVTHRANCVKPNGIWAAPHENPNFQEVNAGDTTDATQFITAVDVYRVYADDTSAVTLVGDKNISGNGNCSDNCDDDTCTGCARIVDPKLGIVQVRPSDCTCCMYPERVRIYYRAGLSLVNGYVNGRFGKVMTRLANTMMPYRPCPECAAEYDVWAADNFVESGAIPPNLVNNPFGIKKGEIAAWKLVKSAALGQGGKVTRGIKRYWSRW